VIQVVASINREVGGPAVTVPRLASYLGRAGVDSHIATIDDPGFGSPYLLSAAQVTAVPARMLARRMRGWSPALAHALQQLTGSGVDVVHSHGMWMFPNLYARRAALRFRVPLVVSPRGMLDRWSLRRSRVRKYLAWNLFERGNLEAAALFHATSVAEAQSIRAMGFAQPIAVIPNGVDLADPAAVPGRSVLERLHGELTGKHWLLFMSRLHPKKGIAGLVRVWRELSPQFPDWQLLVAGPDLDGHGAEVRSQVAAFGLAQRVTFTGMLHGEQKSCALAHSEIMALPTHSENFGIVIAEALAHGTPVITTRAAPWEGLEERNCGWWIEDSEAALRSALCEALGATSGQRREMGERGREFVAARYAWDRVALEMKSIYLWLREGGARPACVQEP
jgi:glycosyltransferase involved in cell wall biosynthesis